MSDKIMKFDPAHGTERPYPSHAQQYRDYHGRVAWLFNPWTGGRRDPRDIGSDTFGHLILPDGEGLRAMTGAALGGIECAGQQRSQYENKLRSS